MVFCRALLRGEDRPAIMPRTDSDVLGFEFQVSDLRFQVGKT
jgi:hypothetical protein